MGGQQYLLRQAAGLSLFQDISASPQPEAPPASTAQTDAASNVYVQEYDDKGRPRCAAIERYYDAEIIAKNSLLEIVGICRQRESAKNKKNQDQVSKKHVVSDAENGDAYTLFWISSSAQCVTNWSIAYLKSRILCGLVNTSLPFTQIVYDQVRPTSAKTCLRYTGYQMLRGFHTVILDFCTVWLEEPCKWLAQWLTSSRIDDIKREKTCAQYTSYLHTGCYMLLQTLLSPMPIYIALAEVDAISTMLPPLGAWNPRSRLSPINWTLSALVPTRSIWTVLLTPLPLMLAATAIKNRAVLGASVPNESVVADPATTTDISPMYPKVLLSAPWSSIQRKLFDITGVSSSEKQSDGKAARYRSGRLAQLPTFLMSETATKFIWDVVGLPLRAAVLRSVMYSVPTALLTRPLSPLLSSINGTASIVNKALLCIALSTVLNVGTWTAVYGATRYVGVVRYGWPVKR